MRIELRPHRWLELRAFRSTFPVALGDATPAPEVLAMLSAESQTGLERDERLRRATRDLLRVGGYKPTGRGKPASEYLVRAAGDGTLASINLAVDACNVVSLHSGLPISVIDLDRATPPLSIRLAPEGTSYVFNASGQEIRVDGLVCLFDAEGPCANAVKDSQRTKTGEDTVRTVSVVWGTRELPGRTEDAVRWYRQILAEAGASTAS